MVKYLHIAPNITLRFHWEDKKLKARKLTVKLTHGKRYKINVKRRVLMIYFVRFVSLIYFIMIFLIFTYENALNDNYRLL